MRIGIVGAGVVGKATARCYIEHVDEVRTYDIIKEKCTHTLAEVLACDIVFVCLPTPQRAGGIECDTSIIEEFFRDLRRNELTTMYPNITNINFVLRSTVPIGTTRRLRNEYGLNIVHSPEFLTARCADTDAQLPSRNVIGGMSGSQQPEAYFVLDDLYNKRFPHVPVLCMSSDDSEAVKLFLNGFFAVKVAYWNEVNTLVDKFDLDWQNIMSGVLSDGRISPSHTKVPGPDGKYGYAGSCLPKDIANLITHFDAGQAAVTIAAYTRNQFDRQREVKTDD